MDAASLIDYFSTQNEPDIEPRPLIEIEDEKPLIDPTESQDEPDPSSLDVTSAVLSMRTDVQATRRPRFPVLRSARWGDDETRLRLIRGQEDSVVGGRHGKGMGSQSLA